MDTKPYELTISQLDFSQYRGGRKKATRGYLRTDDVTEIVELPVVGTVRAMAEIANDWLAGKGLAIPEIKTGRDGRTTTTFFGSYDDGDKAPYTPYVFVTFKTVR